MTESNSHGSGRYLWLLFYIGLAVLLVVFLYSVPFLAKMTPSEFGDYFGGTANPLLTFLTVIGLLLTIRIQQAEIRESQIQFERSATALKDQHLVMLKQSFESTFFQMLTIHNDIVNSMDLVGVKSRVGRDCFEIFYNFLIRSYDDAGEAAPGHSDAELLSSAYEALWGKYQQDLGHYFRFLYNFIKYVKQSGPAEGPYVKIIRSQLSDKELLMLFYNCLSVYGQKFKPLAEEFALFDNMPPMLLRPEHAQLMEVGAFGDNAHYGVGRASGTEQTL